MSFETQSSHQNLQRVELNSSRIEIIFQFETRELRKMVGNHFTTQEKLRIIVIVVNNDQDSVANNIPYLNCF